MVGNVTDIEWEGGARRPAPFFLTLPFRFSRPINVNSLFSIPLSQWERERKAKDTGCPIEPGMTETAKAVFRLLREWPKETKGLCYALAMFCYDLAMFAMFLRCFVAMLL